MRARDVMSRTVYTATPRSAVGTAAELMRDRNIGFLPVVDESVPARLVGVVTDRDLMLRALAEGRGPDLGVRFAMSTFPLVSAPESAEIHDVVSLMARYQIRRLPIIGPDGTVSGVVSQGDLALTLGPTEPRTIEALVERVSTPSWLSPHLSGPVRRDVLGESTWPHA